MSEALQSLRATGCPDRGLAAPFGIFAAWRLQAYGYILAALYAVLLVSFYRAGIWLVDGRGVPVYTDFTCFWVAGLEALHGETASLYVPAEFLRVQDALVGAGRSGYSTWPYPPPFLLILAPFAMLPYVAAFLTWSVVTLLGCIAVVYLIVRRPPAVALVLASPFTAWNFLGGQNGFLTASLLGASLAFLERRPVLAGVFIGGLTYKPQFGILLPLALAAARQWRAFASAAATAAVLAGVSIAAFGIDVWAAFPRALVGHTGIGLSANVDETPILLLGRVQSVYGIVRMLQGGTVLALLAQVSMALVAAMTVWLVWRSRVRYSLKAATLSAAALIATPWASACDMAAIVIPVAFLAKDQISHGLLRYEQAIMVALFSASLVILLTFGGAPIGPVVMITLLCVISRRALCYGGRQPAGAPLIYMKARHHE